MTDAKEEETEFEWTTLKVLWAIVVFLLTGVAEIMGGWFVWAAIRGNNDRRRPWWFALIGSVILILYGFAATLQPTNNFGRVYSTYGGFFIVMSLLFGWLLDGDRPDIGDWIGSAIALGGVMKTRLKNEMMASKGGNHDGISMENPESKIHHGSIPITSTPSPEEAISSHLSDLFLGPTQGIEKAFDFVLGMIKSQQTKYEALTLEHAELRTQNGQLLENMKDVQESCLQMIAKSNQKDNFKEILEEITLDSRNMIDSVKGIKDAQNTHEKNFSNLKEEVKVMAFNLQLDTTAEEQEFHKADSSCSPPSDPSGSTDVLQKDSLEMRSLQHSIAGATPNTRMAEDAHDGILDTPGDDPIGNSSIAENMEHPPVEIQLPGKAETSCGDFSNEVKKIPDAQLQSASSSLSVTSCRKLSADETLAARLNRIENDKDKLRQEILDIKNALKDASVCDRNIEYKEHDIDSFMEKMQSRVSMVEHFLSGFGILPDEGKASKSKLQTLHGSSSATDATPLSDEGSSGIGGNDNLTNTKKEIIDTHVRSSPKASEDSTTVSDDGGEHNTISKSFTTIDSSTGGDQDHVLLSSPPNSRLPNTTHTVPGEERPTEKNNSSETSVDIITKHQSQGLHHFPLERSNDANSADVPAISAMKTILDNKRDDTVNTSGRHRINSVCKQHGLLLYLIEQEDRFKAEAIHISNRISELEKIANKEKTEVSKKPLTLDSEQIKPESNISNSNESDLLFCRSELDSLRGAMTKITSDIETKVTIDLVKQEIATCLFDSKQSITDEIEYDPLLKPPNNSDEALHTLNSSILRQLKLLNDTKIDRLLLSKELSMSQESILLSFNEAIGRFENRVEDELRVVQYNIDECKGNIEEIEKRPFATSSVRDDLDIDQRIRDATQAVQSNLNEVLSSRLEGLQQVENEMEKVASQLAEKPDQEQINKMLQDLELSVFKHVGIDDDVKSVLDSMKIDLKYRMTKEQVLGLVKQLIKGAKEGITKNTTSLMIGYKCIGCSEINSQGVNQFIASKVNHNALPRGRNMTIPACQPYYRSGPDTQMRNLAPLRRKTATTLSFRQPHGGKTRHRLRPRPRPRPRSSPIGYNIKNDK